MELYFLCFDRDGLDNGAFGPERPNLGLCEWQAKCKGNYMLYLIDNHGFKRKYYCPSNPVNPIFILLYHACCLCGVKMTNMICGSRSVWLMYSTKKHFDAVGPVKESTPQDTLKDLIWYMHFADDWYDIEWDTLLHSTSERRF